MTEIVRSDLIHKELSYQIVGACFDAYNEIGPGHKEKYYQKAVAVHLKKRGISCNEEVHTTLEVQGEHIGDYFFDLLVDASVIVEFKVGRRFRQQDYEQVKRYLIKSDLELGILVRFDESGVTFQRVLRPIDPHS